MNIDINLGDCRDYIKQLPDAYFDLIIADPPYGNLVNEDWDQTLGNYLDFTKSWLVPCKRLLKPTGSIYVWCSIGPKSSSLLDIATVLKEHYYFQDMIVWNKQRGRGNRKGWLFTREELLWSTVHKKDYKWNTQNQYSKDKYHESWIKRLNKQNNPYKRATNVWSDIDEESIRKAKEAGGRKQSYKMAHPTEKPVEIMERIIKAHCSAGDTILDPFAGSGPTLIAAMNCNCNVVAIEKEEKYADLIKSRLKAKQAAVASNLFY